MLNERIKMAESIDTVHTHTHTHTPYSYKQNWWTVWRELHFSEIKCFINRAYLFTLDSNRPIKK